jgi:hypothetical protein
LLSFLDRSNGKEYIADYWNVKTESITLLVGNAKLDGLLVDIGITDGAAYNTALALYFVGSMEYLY